MDKPTLYIETSIVSYLAADLSQHPVTAANQRLTHEWWNTRRHNYALFTSEVVMDEASLGDLVVASRRLELLKPIPILRAERLEIALAHTLQQQIPLPPQAREDALHIATAATRG